MCPGLSADIQQLDESRKTAIINKELTWLNFDVAGLQETGLANSSSLRESDIIFWQGLSQDELRQHGVRNSLLATIETLTGGSKRITALRMTSTGFANFLSAYAPTLTSSQEVKDQFYENLEKTVSQIPRSESLYLLGDFNACVGSNWQAWPACLGQFGVGKLNENNQRLLELFCHHGLSITKSYFKCKDLHTVPRRHPWSHHWHQLDLVITRRMNFTCEASTVQTVTRITLS